MQAPSRCLVRGAGRALLAAAVWLAAGPAAWAMTPIVSEAMITYTDPMTGRTTQQQSNSVMVQAEDAIASIQFYTDASFTRNARVTSLSSRLFIQATASACNHDPMEQEFAKIVVQSRMTGVEREYAAVETTPNSGQFRTRDEVMVSDAMTPTSRAIDVSPDDTLSATLEGCGNNSVQAWILVDPSGVVFDESTNAPVAGARVRLIDVTGHGNGGRPGDLAVVWMPDAVTRSPSDVMTGPDGVYTFPLIAPSNYRLDITPPKLYKMPAGETMASAPAGRRVVAKASFGQTFTVDTITPAVLIDVPLSALPRALLLQKSVSRPSAEIAESVMYSVTVKNVGQVDLDDVSLHDTLPPGFAILPGSTRIDGAPAADPVRLTGRTVDFAVGALALGATKRVTYRAVIHTSALGGDGVNRVTAHASQPVLVSSNEASAVVAVQAGVFTSQTTVLGTVFADCNRNGVQDVGEPGAPGVRIWMEDGTSVTTDGAGRYSLYGISPRTHVLKLDSTTLPPGAEPVPIGSRNAGNGRTRFIDPRNSELHRADFAFAGCAADLVESLRKRAASSNADRELRTSLKTDLLLTPAAKQDVRALPASGLIGDTDSTARAAQSAAAAASAPSAPLSDAAASGVPAGAAPKGLAFLDLEDGHVLPNRPLTLRVQSRAGVPARLQVGAQTVGEDRIGEKRVDTEHGVEQREYVGVVLPTGETVLSMVQSDGFGNVRERREIRVHVAGPLASLKVSAPQGQQPSDGTTRIPVTVTLHDAQGLPVIERHAVTLSASIGDWDVVDLDPSTPDTQTFIEGPTATWQLRAPAQAGRADIRVQSGAFKATGRIDFAAPLRPMMAVGVVEGILNFRKLKPESIVPAQSGDGFEQELREFADNHHGGSVGGRAALFLKGKVRGDHLLTIGYDSDKDRQQRLFRDIQPDTFYPVYGDASVKGFDAQSTGRLYVRLEKDKSFVLYGDFTTQTTSTIRQLGAYQRSLTGLRYHHETDTVRANVFASRDSTRQMVTEIAGNGTSGPYLLPAGNAMPNSERVELLVRDRNQPSLVLAATPQVRFTDYEIEPLSGRLLFRAPVPSVDANLNPISVRITYEIEQGGEKFLVVGGDVQVNVTDRIEVGGAYAHDSNPMAPLSLSSVNTTVKFTPQTTLTLEAAHIDREVTKGDAQRVELLHQKPEGLQVRAFAGRSDTGFVNPSSMLSAGRREGGVKASMPINSRTRLIADALTSGDVATGAQRHGVLVGVEHSLGAGTKVETGVRLVEEQAPDTAGAAGESTKTQSVRAKVTTVIPGFPRASVFGEVEQSVTDSDKRMLAIGGEYQLASQGRVYARHELISSLGGPFMLDANQRRNTTVLGIDGDYMKDGRLFGEYRGRNAFGDRETEAAIGLRNRWQLAEGLRLNTTFEHVQALSGPATNDSIATTGAIEYTANPLWKGTARLEARHATTGDSFLSTLGLARKVNDDWTALAKNVYAIAHQSGTQPTRIQERFQVGAAYRDTTTNRMNGLTRYEFKRESGMAIGDMDRRVHSVSSHIDHHPNRALTLTAMHAAKWVRESGDGIVMNHRAQMVTARATRDINDRWDLGVAVRMLSDGSFRNRQQGVGVEAGYRVQEQMWVSAGYNAQGFRDRDLAPDRSTERGFYVRLRFKFDESLLQGSSL